MKNKEIDLVDMPVFSEFELDEHIYNIETKGYSVVENFLTVENCKLLKELYICELEKYSPKASSERSQLDQYHIHDLLNNNILFGQLLEDPRLQQLLTPFLGMHWIMYAFTTSSLPPHGINYGHRIHVDSPRFIKDYITNMGVIWALDDFTEENGATKVLSASQHKNIIPEEDFFEKNCTQLTCKKGTLVLFNARLVHRAGKNNTNNWRHSLTLNACRPYMKQRMDWVRFIKPEIVDNLSEQAKRIIGFDTRLPSSLDELFLPEEKRLYKANQE